MYIRVIVDYGDCVQLLFIIIADLAAFDIINALCGNLSKRVFDCRLLGDDGIILFAVRLFGFALDNIIARVVASVYNIPIIGIAYGEANMVIIPALLVFNLNVFKFGLIYFQIL